MAPGPTRNGRPMKSLVLFAVFAIALVACAPGTQNSRPGTSGGPAEPRESNRTLVAATRVEPGTVASRAIRLTGVALYLSKRLFNAELALLDERGRARPYLAEALPQLNTDSWRVFPDGTMETTWHLKPDLTWHDGTPLSAEDFVFGRRVYSTPDLGEASLAPYHAIEDVTAPDARTVVVHWKQPYPDAGVLSGQGREFPPLPRHILEPAFTQLDLDNFANHAYWTREYVGLGPFRMERWEPGAFYEATPFAAHVFGRAKIPRIKVLFISDANTALANLLTGEVQLSADTSLRLEQASTLKREWAPRNAGFILLHPNQWRSTVFQLRPDVTVPRAILDQRVRKALAHAVEKEAINETIYQGDGVYSDFMIAPSSEWGPALESAVVKYPYDLRRSEQLMVEAGYARGADGMFAHPSEGRFAAELKTNAAADNEAEMAIMASGWRQAGFSIQEAVLPAALAQDGLARSTFPGLFTNNVGVGENTLGSFTSFSLARQENGWRGSNRSGWQNAEYDRLAEAFGTTLDRTERARQVARMAHLLTDDLGAISLFFRTQPWAHAAALKGLQVVAPEANMAWNVHEWEWAH
jgi:peptide/nickel transport system substrate-binding protein